MPKTTLHRRLFVFLLALVILMTLGSIIILLALEAPLIDNTREIKLSVERELSVFSRDFEAHMGDTSVQLVRLSESLSKHINPESLKNHPELLGTVIEYEFDRLIAAMDRSKSSGVFLILDATGNPDRTDAANSRAGVCFRVSEPDLLKPEMPKRFLRGEPTADFPDDYMMLSDWEPEFDVKDRAFYHLPLANNTPYWGMESITAASGGSTASQASTILCSIPVAGTNGEAWGVCGFEINRDFYAARYLPEINGYKHSFCLITANDGNGPDIKEGAVLNTYQVNGKKFLGHHKNITIHSEPANPQFVMAVLIPKEEIDSQNFRIRLRLVVIITALLCFGIFVSRYISRRYLRPVLSSIDQLVELIQKKDEINGLFTPEEIDVAMLLIEGKMRSEISRSLHLSSAETDRRIESIRGKIDINGDSNPLVATVAKEYRLTQREKDIFCCLLKGMTNAGISAELFISEGTVKIHVRNLLKKIKLENRQGVKIWSETFSLQKGIV